MKKSIRKVLAVLGAFLCLIILLVAGIWFCLWSDPVQRLVQDKLNQSLAGTITWERSRASFLCGDIELNNILFKGSEGATLISVDRFFVNISWIGLFGGNLIAETVILEKPRLWLASDAEGGINVMQALVTPEDHRPESANGAIPFNILVKKLSLVDGFFQYTVMGDAGETKNDSVTFDNINLLAEEGNLFDKTIKLDLQISGGEINIADITTALDKIRVETVLSRDRLDPMALNLSAGGSTVAVTGSIEKLFSDLFLDLDLSILTSLPETRKMFQLMPEMAGSAKTHLTIKGALNNPHVALEMACCKVRFAGNRIDRIALDLLLEDRCLYINSLNLAAPSGDLDLAGLVDLQKAFPEGFLFGCRNLDAGFYKLNLKLKTPDMAETLSLVGLEDFHGEIGLDVRVAGTFDQPLVDAGLQGKNISFENIHVPELDAGLRFARGRLFLDQCRLSSDNSRLEISGIIHVLDHRTLKPVKDPTFDLKLAGAKLFIEDFVDALKGKLAINGHIKGSISHPEGYVTLEGEDVDLGVQKICNVHLSSRLDGSKVHIDPLVIAVAPGEETRIEGWLSQEQHYELKMVSKGISLKHFGMLQGQGVGDGKIAFSLSGKGNFGDPALKGDVVLSGVRLNNEATEDFLFQVDVQDQAVQIQGDLNFELKGNFHLQTKEFSVIARFDQTDPAPYAMFSGWDDLNGVVTGKIEAIGNISAPDQVSVQADMTRLDLFYKGKELLTTKRFKASFKNGEVSIPGIHLVILKQGFVDIRGRGNLGGQLEFEAEGSVPLHGVPAFTDALPDISGEVDFSAALEGSLAEPDFKAEINLKRVGLIVPGSMQHVREGEGSIHVTSRNIILKDIHGTLDSGQFDLNGKIDLEQFQPALIEIQVNAHELPLNIPDILEMRIDADLVIRGTPEKSMIVGKAVLLEGKYYQDVKLNLIESMGKKRRKEALPRFEEALPILKNMGFDIALKHKAPFIVENNLALLKVRPDLYLYGEVTRPLLSGRAEVESGIITFERKEFEIRKGVFDFVNPYRIEPDIDVQSEIVVRDWTIFLDVSGRPDNLEFKLSSDPPEDNRDILSLLVFGQTNREMDEASSGLSASPTQMIADMATLTLQESLKSATGLDMVELEYKEQEDEDGSDEIKITVGKRLSRKLAVTYGMETKKGEVVHRVTTEHKILEKLIINAFDDSEGVFGGEILFRLEFR